MKILWDYTFVDCLKINPSEHRVLLTEPPGNPAENRQKMYTHMFDVYGFAGAMVAIQAVLVLYAQGLLTGVVLDSGDGVSHVIPVFEGYGMPNIIQRVNVAGRHVTKFKTKLIFSNFFFYGVNFFLCIIVLFRQLINLLQLRGYNLNRTADFDTARQIKESLCYVGYDLEIERRLALETTTLVRPFQLPDGRVIKVGRERFEAAEVLFDPSKVGVEGKGLAELLWAGINKADMDLRPQFYKHIVLSGGTTMFAGLPSRLERDMKELWVERVAKGDRNRLSKFKLKIEDPPRRKNMVFLGGSVLADIMKEQPDFWLSKEEWKEKGPQRAMAEKHKKGT
ncbi:actin-related protein 2 [Reticulomyxa filosa]|uniref:Actin-related protein 2 n=1 Tax=Reticulomyxa filosa TaxID=46433 RepID=X6NCI4_RETFI|nr:actin-related protein 2 [Reticulomyxa filosa]|eukprot:ETO23469.1 actin-related protein 2 [Reticulomyxa filosa]